METKNQVVPILLNLLAALVGAIGQYFYKLGASRLGHEALWKNWPLYTGMLLFCAVMVLFVVSFKLGGRLSVVYPVYATTFLWGTLLAIVWDKEPWTYTQLAGVLLILLGVTLVALGATKA